MIAPTGRCEARGSPWNSVATLARAATGGTNRITVPALPTSTRVSPAVQPGDTRQAVAPGPPVAGPVPPWCRCRVAAGVNRRPQRAEGVGHQQRVPGQQRVEDVGGPAARAARTSARLVMDFDPGTRTRARSGPLACGPPTAVPASGAGRP